MWLQTSAGWDQIQFAADVICDLPMCPSSQNTNQTAKAGNAAQA